jgi:hypothetical protein
VKDFEARGAPVLPSEISGSDSALVKNPEARSVTALLSWPQSFKTTSRHGLDGVPVMASEVSGRFSALVGPGG